MDEGIYDLLSRGRIAAKVGDVQEARFYLEWVLMKVASLSPERLEALYWLSEISPDPQKKRAYLEDILAAEPTNARARVKIAILDGKLDPAKTIDPDRLSKNVSSTAVELADEEAQRFTCPECGGRMTYRPDGSSLACEYCEVRQRFAEPSLEDPAGFPPNSAVREEDFLLSMATVRGHLHPVATQEAACQGCGASFVIPPSALTLNCPYCGSAYVIDHAEERQLIPPGGLVPFSISAREALRSLQTWLTRHHIRPEHTITLPQGVYLPSWSFSMGGQIDWRGYKESTKGLEPVTGSYPIFCRDVLVPACPRMREQFVRQLSRYQLDRLVPYDPRYLVDWLAETYQVAVADASLDARENTFERGKLEVKTLYLDGVSDVNFSSAGMVVESFKLILLPVWISHYREEGKRWDALINGQTGDVEGQTPGGNIQGWFDRIFG